MRMIGGLIGLALLAGPALADGLAVKPGLWEVTPPANATGAQAAMPAIPADQLAKMTPQQQAMVQQRLAAIAAGGAAAKPRRYCLTQAMIDRGFIGPEADHRCTRTVIASTPALLAYSVACTGDHPANGTIKLEAKDAQTITSTTDMTLTIKDGQTMPMHRAGEAHWLADDCGDVKPKE